MPVKLQILLQIAWSSEVEKDLRNEKISYKVREYYADESTFILAVGGREAEAGTVALRRLGSNEQRVIDTNEALAMLRAESLAPIWLMSGDQSLKTRNVMIDCWINQKNWY